MAPFLLRSVCGSGRQYLADLLDGELVLTRALTPYSQHPLVFVAHGDVAGELVARAFELGEALVHLQQEADIVRQFPLLAAAVAVEARRLSFTSARVPASRLPQEMASA